MSNGLLQIVQLTPPGRGAIASLLVEGRQAVEVVDRRLRSGAIRFRDQAMGRLVVGRIGPGVGEQVVALRRSDHTVELHCHGGQAAVARIMEVFIQEGCVAVDWRRWTAQRHADPIAADAYQALADARTERAAVILADQYGGALRGAVEAIRTAIGRRDLVAARRQVDELLSRAELGRHLIEPWQVVLAGEPNVGKSSLINALLGYARAIVHPTPGTTRDIVTAITAIDGWPVELADTAGLRQTDETVERAGVELAHRRLSDADLVILVFDATGAGSQDDDRLAHRWPGAIRVVNKIDLGFVRESRKAGGCLESALATSAVTGEGIDSLLAAIAARLVHGPLASGLAVPFRELHVAQLRSIDDALAAEDLRAAEAMAARFGYG